jgi:hypothetical protein
MVKVKITPNTKKTSKKITRMPKLKTITKSINHITLSRQQIEESIRLKAYELYLLRLGQNGNALSDWLNAEKAVLQTP